MGHGYNGYFATRILDGFFDFGCKELQLIICKIGERIETFLNLKRR